MFVKFTPVIDNSEIRKFRLEFSKGDIAFATIDKKTGKFTYEGYKSTFSSTNPYKIEEIMRKTFNHKGKMTSFSYGVG